MQKYRVIVHGQNLLTDVEGVRQRAGFYTNVFVEAFASADAEAQAIELVSQDAHLHQATFNAEDGPLRLSADEVAEIKTFDGVRLPRTGLAFYPEESVKT